MGQLTIVSEIRARAALKLELLPMPTVYRLVHDGRHTEVVLTESGVKGLVLK